MANILVDAYEKKKRQTSIENAGGTTANKNPLVAAYDEKIARESQYARAYAEKMRRQAQQEKQREQQIQQGRQLTDFRRTEREDLAANKNAATTELVGKSSSYLPWTEKWKLAKRQEQETARQQRQEKLWTDIQRADRESGTEAYDQIIQKGKQSDNVFNANYGLIDYLNKDKREVLRAAQKNFTYMTDREKELYYYLNGRYGAKAASDFVDSLGRELNRRATDTASTNTAAFAKEHPVVGTVLDAGIAVAGSGAYPALLYEQAIKGITGDYEEMDPNDPRFGGSVMTEGIRTGITDNEALKSIIPNDNVRDFLVGTGLSMGENIGRLPFGVGGLAIAAGGAGLSGTRDALQRGGNTQQAVMLGAANAAAEAFFEKFSLEGLEGLKTAPGKGVRMFLKNMGKQALTEGSEEVFTEVANEISDKLIMQELSRYSTTYKNCLDQGMNQTEAKKAAFLEFLQNVGLAGAGGALSGGLMGAGSQAVGNIALNQYGKTLNEDYRDYAQGIDTNREHYSAEEYYDEAVNLQRLAEDYAGRQKRGEFISNRDKADYDIRMEQWLKDMAEQAKKGEELPTHTAQEASELRQAEKFTGEEEKQEAGADNEPETAEETTVPEKKQAAYDRAYDMIANGEQESQNRENEIRVPILESRKAQEAEAVSKGQEALTAEEGENAAAYVPAYGKRGGEVLTESYDGSVEIPVYNRAFGRAYDAGYHQIDMGIAEHAAIMSVLTEEQFKAAYKAGAQDFNDAYKVDLKTGQPTNMIQGAPKTGGLGTISENATNAQRRIGEYIGKKTGLTINLVESLDVEGAEASYKNGQITLSVNASDFNGAVTHEITHFIKEYSPKGYKMFSDIAIEAEMKAQNVSYDSLVESYEARYSQEGQELTREEIMEEITADATQKFLNDPEFIGRVMEKDKGLAEKIIDFLTDIVDAIKEMIKVGSTRSAAKGLEEDLQYFEDARDVWILAAEDAGARYKSGMEVEWQGKEKNILENPGQVTENHIEQNYKMVQKMDPAAELTGSEFPKGDKDLVSQVTEFYESVGGKVHNDVVGDIYLDRESVKSDIGHGIGRLKAISFAAVPDVLQKGRVLNYNENWKGRKYDSAVIGAKIKIDQGKYAGEYYELAVVKIAQDNRMYLHEVHTIKVGDTAPIKTPSFLQSSSRSDTRDLPSVYSIFEKLLGVKEENIKNDGVKFQLEDVEELSNRVSRAFLEDENKALKKANELLQNRLELTKKQFEVTSKAEMRQQDIKKVAKGLLEKYGSAYSDKTLAQNLTKLYEYIRSTDQVDGQELLEAASSIAKGILKKPLARDIELAEQYKDIRKQIRETKIKISEQDKADLGSLGGYNAFRKKYFGRIRLGNEGSSIDSLYQELSSQHPELFPSSITHPADQLIAVGYALDQMQEQVTNIYGADIDEMSFIVGQEILESYFAIRNEPPTFADKKQAEIQRLKDDYVKSKSALESKAEQKAEQLRDEYAKKMGEYKTSLKQKYRERVNDVKQDIITRRDALKIKYEQEAARGIGADQKEMKRLKQEILALNQEQAQIRNVMNPKKYVESARRAAERQQRSRDKQQITKDVQAMQRWLIKPDKTHHVPDGVKNTVLEFLHSIDYSSDYLNQYNQPTARTKAWNELETFYQSIAESGAWQDKDTGEMVYCDGDPDMLARIKDLRSKADDIKRLEDLSAHEMEDLRNIVTSMKKTIEEMNTLKSNERSESLEKMAHGIVSDLLNRKNRTEYAGDLLGPADQLFNYDMLDPQTMFGLMGDNMKSLYDSLRTGLDKKTRMLKDAQDYVNALKEETKITDKELRKWTGKGAEEKEFELSGDRKIKLTIAQIMSLYELNKRGQARGHIYDRQGGISQAPRVSRTRIEGGKLALSQVIKEYAPIRVSEAEVQNIIDVLTPEQKAFADGLQRFMGINCAAWGNDVTVQMYGYKKFTASNYFPIVTNKNYITTVQGDLKNQSKTIQNLGITKSTVQNAHNPIIIEDIMDVFSRQSDQMSTYNAYLMPLSDLNKVQNYINKGEGADVWSIKQEIERAFGKKGNEYIDKLVKDINGSVHEEKSLGDRLLSNWKASAVGGNLRVAIQQPTAYLRAAMEIDGKYLVRGAMTRTQKGQWDLICKYAPIAQWKDWGFYRMDTSRQMKDIMFGTDSLKNRITNATMIGAEMGDKAAWNRLWRACEYECMDKHPDLERESEEFYKEVGRRFSEIVDKTQVVDSTLHRTQIMRSQNGLTKLATSFMAEPLKSYDMLYRAGAEVRLGVLGAKKRAVRAGSVYVLTAAATALAASVMDAMRDNDRDKTFGEKYWENFWGNVSESITFIGNVPWAKDIYATLMGDTPVRSDMAGFQDIGYAIREIAKAKRGESKYTPQYVILYAARQASNITGMPVKNIERDAEALLDTVINYKGSAEADYGWLKQKYNMGNTDNLNLYAGMMIEARRSGNQELEGRIKADLNKAKVNNDTISKKIKNMVKAELITKDSVDPRIDAAAQAVEAADDGEYKALVQQLIAEGYSGELVSSAVDMRIKQLAGDEDIDWEAEEQTNPDDLYEGVMAAEGEAEAPEIELKTPYSSSDLVEAVKKTDSSDKKSYEEYNAIVSRLYQTKKENGMKESKIPGSIKSAITKEYKEKWIEAYRNKDQETYEAIQNKLKQLKVNGKYLYGGDDWISWRKEAKEKK
ncbi:hypothetical protein [Lacrimispora sp. 210928-DFI.3.58]|uniref:hypothetical protein n=1 Tax=Lacrimispora sp. 210928-DFI.3.58 TaxID=2883214 RepID=UPI001D068B7C|nr:hypothetical protein [Lacrimispora sp. 210928-DFI.3.58]MCB7317516.1 hypothetical protein [Lacrimispora sp. 210928-DFI.3.58]